MKQTHVQMLEAMEQAETFVDFVTGVKAKLVAQGWHEHHAEKIVIAMIERGGQA